MGSVLRGGVALFPAFMTLLFALFLQMSANEYYGYRCARRNALSHPDSDDRQDRQYIVMHTLSNALAILAATVAFPMVAHLKWVTVVYVVLMGALMYFYFGGPRPLVLTRWGLLVTFIFFGPIAVSGTAFVQRPSWEMLVPIAVYSVISGVLAVNTHLSIQYLRRQEDVRDGMTSLIYFKGIKLVRLIYLFNVALVCVLMMAFPFDLGFGGRLYGAVVPAWLIITAAFAVRHMNDFTQKSALRIRLIVIVQYVTAMIVLLAVVLISMESYWIGILHPHH